jgi:hypothetical protein
MIRKMKYFFLSLFILWGLPALAQCTFSTVSGTVTDPSGIPYVNGSVTLNLAPNPPGNILCGGQSVQGHIGPVQLDSTGSFAFQVPENTAITPSGTQWTFTVAESPGVAPPLGFGPVSFNSNITINTSPQSVSTTLSAAAPALARTVTAGTLTLQTNGTPNSSQSLLNLVAGSNITLTNVGGAVTIASTGGGGGTPCTTTALSIQFNNAGAFGCEPDLTFTAPHTLTLGAAGILTLTAGATVNGITAAMLPATTVNSVVNDTNVTGSISAQALTLGWTGTLAAARLNANVVQAITNDTNITGSISAQNLTLGWTGTLAVARGGTGTASPGLVAGTNITITGSWPNQTINSSAGGSTAFPVTVTGGVSGAVPCFTSTTVEAAGTLLPSGDFVLGGGAGGCPTATFSIVPIANGGTGTGSTLTGLVRGSGSAMTAAELSADVTTSGSNATTLAKIQGTVVTLTSPALGQTLSFNATPALVNGYPGVPVDTQASATPTIHGDGSGSDRVSLLLTTNNTTSTATPLSQAGTTGFASNYALATCNAGSVVNTITPATSTINGNATIKLVGQVAGNNPECALIYSDNTNFFAAEILPTDANGRLQAAGFPALTGDVTNTAGTLATTIAALAVTGPKMAVVQTRRSCDIPVGDTSGSAITSAQLGPQSRICFIPAGATIVEMDVNADGGTPNVIVGRNRAGTIVNIVSAALATAASGGIACSNTGGTTGINGATTCSSTLQNTGLNAGDYLELVSGTAGGTAKFFVVHIIYTVS